MGPLGEQRLQVLSSIFHHNVGDLALIDFKNVQPDDIGMIKTTSKSVSISPLNTA